MDRFREEISEIAILLFSKGDRIFETESFILEITESKNYNSSQDWRKKIAEFLADSKNCFCNVNILDKKTNVTKNLLQINALRMRNLYMELVAALDLNKHFIVEYSEDHILFSIVYIDEPV